LFSVIVTGDYAKNSFLGINEIHQPEDERELLKIGTTMTILLCKSQKWNQVKKHKNSKYLNFFIFIYIFNER